MSSTWIKIPYSLAAVSAIICIWCAPIKLSVPYQLLLSAGAVFAVAGCFWLDNYLIKSHPILSVRIIRLSMAFTCISLLIPVAMRAPKGSALNFWADLITYSAVVAALSLFIAIRWAPVSYSFTFPQKLRPEFFVLGFGFIYLIVLSLQLNASHNAFSNEWVDMSWEYASIWQSAQGNWWRLINQYSENTHMLRYHWPLFYVFIVPFAKIWGDLRFIQWIFTFFIGMGAWAVYLLALSRGCGKKLASALAVIYLVYLPVHMANLFDLHADPFAMPFILFSFYFAVKKKWLAYAIMVALALSCKEYVGLAYMGFGAWLWFNNKLMGAATAITGLAAFLAIIQAGIPYFNQGQAPEVIRLTYGGLDAGGGLSGIVMYALSHPPEMAGRIFTQNNITALISLFLPLLFLPLRNPFIIAAGGLISLKNMLTGNGMNLLNHRESLFIPFIVYGLIITLSKLRPGPKRRTLVLAVCTACVLTSIFQGKAFPTRGFWMTKDEYRQSEHDKLSHQYINQIPENAVVMSTSNYATHFMNREWYFLFPRFPTPVTPEYILVDTLEQRSREWLTKKEIREGLAALKKNKNYDLLKENDGIFFFKLRQTAFPDGKDGSP